MKRGGILQRMRTAGLLLALFALVFKAMLPPGFMLSAGADHRIAVEMCGGGTTVLDLGFSGSDRGKHDNQGASYHCPFALAGAPIVSAPDIVTPIPHHQFVDAARTPPEFAFARTSSGPPLPARGPPLHA
jgi:hypothetical protein